MTPVDIIFPSLNNDGTSPVSLPTTFRATPPIPTHGPIIFKFTIVPFLLDGDRQNNNYEDWKILMKNYLWAQDLWSVVKPDELHEKTSFWPSSGEEIANQGIKNAAALYICHSYFRLPGYFFPNKEHQLSQGSLG